MFEYEKEENTLKDTLTEAVKSGANLSYADLRCADLSGANLRDADLRGADLRCANLSGANLRGADLSYADLRCANLSGANLRYADLRGADLSGANLRYADLSYADLRCADLSGADLSYANLRYADLRCANLSGANLSYADLRGADLSCANLSGADLSYADLRNAKEIPYLPIACPTDGVFIGWKKVRGHLVKLEIPEDAQRFSCTSNKCRCDKAKVLGITNLITNESVESVINTSYSPNIEYKVGGMVYPDSFDDNRWNECSHGIHFFINKQEAINY